MNCLNEFELDWAQAAVRSGQIPAGKIRGKKVLVIGEPSSLRRAAAWSFAAWNEGRGKEVSVAEAVWKEEPERAGASEEAAQKPEPECVGASGEAAQKPEPVRAGASKEAARNGAPGTAHGRIEVIESYGNESFAPDEADYVVLTGFCCRDIPESVRETMRLLREFERLAAAVAALPCARALLLSDGRVYGRPDPEFFASEYEMGRTDPCVPGYEAQYVLQTLEGYFLSAMRTAGRPYGILRTARIYGACLKVMEHAAYTLAGMTARGQAHRILLSPDRSSYISIHDMLTAMQFVLAVCPENKIFNAAGPASDASDGEIAMMLYRNFSGQCRVSMEWEEPQSRGGILLNTQLLRRYGFEPQITLEDGLIMLVKSLQDTGGVFIFDNTYMGKLTRVQQILLGYLLEVDRICKKHGIQYFLAGGTLLGAIRHHGFIPWDDDADVMMLREDFDRFMEVVQEELPSNIFVQTPWTEKGNYNAFTKLRIDNTLFATEFTGHFLEMHNGIFFDVLSHDRTGNHRWSQKLHLMWTMLSRSIVFNKWGDTDIAGGGAHPVICRIVDRVKYLVPMPFAQWMQERALRFFQHRKTEYLYDGMGRNLSRGAFPREWLKEAVYVDFEGYSFPVPKEYDKYLTYLYGDYMQMIPVSQRRTSHSIVLTDLGEYSGYECGRPPGREKDSGRGAGEEKG